MELMNAVDEYIPLPLRENEKPFLMPVADVFSITGRGTVVTGRIETGVIKVGDPVEIIGLEEKVLTSTLSLIHILQEEWLVTYPFQHAECPELEWYSGGSAYAKDYLSQIWIPIIDDTRRQS